MQFILSLLSFLISSRSWRIFWEYWLEDWKIPHVFSPTRDRSITRHLEFPAWSLQWDLLASQGFESLWRVKLDFMNSCLVNLPTFLDQFQDFTVFFFFRSVLFYLYFLEHVHLFSSCTFPHVKLLNSFCISTSVKFTGQRLFPVSAMSHIFYYSWYYKTHICWYESITSTWKFK